MNSATPSVAPGVPIGSVAPLYQAPPAPIAVSRGRQSVAISQSLLAAQRAQADLLLASLGDVGLAQNAADATKQNGAGSTTKPPSRGETPAWFPMAMQKALDKYQSSQGLVGSLANRMW